MLEAYGWPCGLGDQEILERLLALNLERASPQETTATAADSNSSGESPLQVWLGDQRPAKTAL